MRPWEETWSDRDVRCNGAPVITTDGLTVIGSFVGDGRRTLAVAAPELYRALEAIVESGSDIPDAKLDAALVALAKANGNYEDR